MCYVIILVYCIFTIQLLIRPLYIVEILLKSWMKSFKFYCYFSMFFINEEKYFNFLLIIKLESAVWENYIVVNKEKSFHPTRHKRVIRYPITSRNFIIFCTSALVWQIQGTKLLADKVLSNSELLGLSDKHICTETSDNVFVRKIRVLKVFE